MLINDEKWKTINHCSRVSDRSINSSLRTASEETKLVSSYKTLVDTVFIASTVQWKKNAQEQNLLKQRTASN